MKKKCVICKVIMDTSEFYKNKSKKDGLNNLCKVCSRAKSKKSYKENKVKYRLAIKRRKREVLLRNRAIVVEHLKDNACVDCGEDDIIVLEFDHIRDKISNISDMIWKSTTKALIKEIAKCEVRCANCHRRKTAIDFNWWIIDIKGSKH